MNNIKEISSEIQRLSLENVNDIEAVKEIHSMCKELEGRKEELLNRINGLALDFSQIAQQSYKEDNENNIEYKCLLAKKDAVMTCLKIIEEQL